MANMHTVYQLTIRTLTPLHIGTGNKLFRGYDYISHRDRTWVVDFAALAATLYDRDKGQFRKLVQQLGAKRPTSLREFIPPGEFQEASQLFRYVAEGMAEEEVWEQLKDAWDRPYIPGSSLKGALRTALAFVGAHQRGLKIDTDKLDPHPNKAADAIEKKILRGSGGKPYDDLLRALQISDSTAYEKLPIKVYQVEVVGTKGKSAYIEAIPPGAKVTATLTLDGFLLSESTRHELRWKGDQCDWLRNIPKVVANFSHSRIVSEIKDQRALGIPIPPLYNKLARYTEKIDTKPEFILQLGWGSGWNSKTFGSLITEEKPVFDAIMDKYMRVLVRGGKAHLGKVFPKTRRIARQDDDGKGMRDEMPLGWIHVKMERLK